MPPNFSNPAAPLREQTESRTGRRLVLAAVFIGLAFGALALIDRYRERPTGLTPPHEPSQALITAPTPGSNAPAVTPELPATAPPPPQVLNNETLTSPLRAATSAPPAEKTVLIPGKAYMIQVGVFTSPANAQALQKQLRREGFEANLETRVRLGPFKNKRDADKALARAKKLGIDAVLVSAR